jgi:hypothetical protein
MVLLKKLAERSLIIRNLVKKRENETKFMIDSDIIYNSKLIRII